MHKQLQIAAVTCIAFLTLVNAQRGSYAGSRPSSGLSQKDKYHRRQSQNVIANRFSDPQIISKETVAFGVAQNPPINGTPVVEPQPVYVPLPPRQQDNDIVNRFGATQQRLPVDALGDQQLVDTLNSIPENNRPFWFLNYQAIEAQRNSSGRNLAAATDSRGSFSG